MMNELPAYDLGIPDHKVQARFEALLESTAYRAFTPDDLFDVVARHGLHFDQSRQTGVVLHMMSALGDAGVFGLTAVADDHDQADRLYLKAVAAFDQEAARLLGPGF